MDDDLECQSEDWDIIALGCQQNSSVLQIKLRKGKWLVQDHMTGWWQPRPALISFGPKTSDPSVYSTAPSSVVEGS